MMERFNLKGRNSVITGGAGLLGRKHAEAVIEAGGLPILLDINKKSMEKVSMELAKRYGKKIPIHIVDITKKTAVENVGKEIFRKLGAVDILINNASIDPKVKGVFGLKGLRFENYSSRMWDKELDVGLKGAMFCSQVFGTEMAQKGRGVILNISSDLGIIAPDQRIYRKEGLSEDSQPVKPVTYSVIKHGIIGLTKYLAVYWAEKGVRVNALCPGGVYQSQHADFVEKLTDLIPMGRMADADEYKEAIIFLISDASSYMTGSTLVIDGGRTCW
ncbi:MAG: SDR family oxidoreductase [Nitrospirae bacterium]|nr:SDR family oxidoreductase [Nitrospirota bacterium]